MDKIKDEEEEFRIRPNEHYLERTLDGRRHDERSNDRHRNRRTTGIVLFDIEMAFDNFW